MAVPVQLGKARATAAAAVVNLPAVPNYRYRILKFIGGYTALAAPVEVTIAFDAGSGFATQYTFPLTSAGVAPIDLDIRTPTNKLVTITLPADAAGIGNVTIMGTKERA